MLIALVGASGTGKPGNVVSGKRVVLTIISGLMRSFKTTSNCLQSTKNIAKIDFMEP